MREQYPSFKGLNAAKNKYFIILRIKIRILLLINHFYGKDEKISIMYLEILIEYLYFFDI